MEGWSSYGSNITWKELSALVCNETFIRMYKLNITCGGEQEEEGVEEGFNNTSNTQVVSPAVVKVAVTAGVIFLLGIFLNVLLLVTLTNKNRFNNPSWWYVINLAIADILCMISMAGFVLYLLAAPANWSDGLHNFLFPSLDIFLSSASMLSVAAVAVDRVRAIRLLQKQNVPTSTLIGKIGKPTFIIGGIWVYSIVVFSLALSRTFIKHNQMYNDLVFWVASSVAFFGAVIVTLSCYIIIVFCYVKYTCFTNWDTSCFTWKLLKVNNNGRNCINAVKGEKLKQKRLTKVLLMAITPLPFISGWSFFLGTQTYEAISKTYVTNLHYNIAMIVVPWLVSALNPLMYILVSVSIRKQIRSYFLVKRCFGVSMVTSKSSSSTNESVHLTEV